MGKWVGISITLVLLAGLATTVYLAQRRQSLQNIAQTSNTKFICDPGIDPYNSRAIAVTNNTSVTIDTIEVNVFHCEYEPGRLESQRGRYKCEDSCVGDDENCQEGVWDSAQSPRDITLAPGQTRTFTMTVPPCSISQLDVQTVAYDPDGVKECHNLQSQDTVAPGERWPGGIAFAIDENSEGYNASTQSCDTPQPTTPPAPSNTPVQPSPTPSRSPTPQPTTPPGQPTYTPIPTSTLRASNPTRTPAFFPTNTPIVFVPTSTRIPPTQPVSGAGDVTMWAIVGGVGLLVLSLL